MTDGQWVFIGFGLLLVAIAALLLVRAVKRDDSGRA